MRVLYATPFVPWPLDTGGRLRAFHLACSIASQVPVELHAVAEPRDLTEARRALEPHFERLVIHERSRAPLPSRLTLSKPERWFYSASLGRELASRSNEPLAVFLEEVFLTRLVPPALRARTLVGHQKIDSEFHRRTHPSPSAPERYEGYRLERLERFAAQHFPNHLTCSEDDAENLKRRFPEAPRAQVLPSGFDPQHFAGPTDPKLRIGGPVVFVGSLDYAPNVDAIEHLMADILPPLRKLAPDVRIQLVGRRPNARVRECVEAGNSDAEPCVELHEDVPDVRPFLERAACVVVPLRIGGGTRLKIVEALALGCPLVSTAVGAQGLHLRSSEHLQIADGPTNFADSVANLLHSPERAAALGQAGARAVHQAYPWDRLGEQLLERLRPLSSPTPPSAPRS